MSDDARVEDAYEQGKKVGRLMKGARFDAVVAERDRLAASLVAAEARAEKLNEQIENHDDMRLARYSTAERDKARAERDEARARVAQLESMLDKIDAALAAAPAPLVEDVPTEEAGDA